MSYFCESEMVNELLCENGTLEMTLLINIYKDVQTLILWGSSTVVKKA